MCKDILLAKRYLPAVLLLLLLFLTGCAAKITGDDFRASRDQHKTGPVVLDVRTRGEYQSGRIPGAVHMPVWSLPFNMARVPVSSRDQKVVVYCAHGPRAGLAGFFLKLSGFSNVHHLEGDFGGWRNGGYSVEKGAGENGTSSP